MIKRLVCGYIPVSIIGLCVLYSIFQKAYIVDVITVIACIDGILGARLYFKEEPYDGAMVLQDKEDGGKLFTLELNGDPERLEEMESVSFKVVTQSS